MLLPVVGQGRGRAARLITTLGPVWDGNEVWLLSAGGATFAAFPEWYATLFSGFYLPLLLILVALILRGVAFEYRSKRSDGAWRRRWDAVHRRSARSCPRCCGASRSATSCAVCRSRTVNGNIEYAGGVLRPAQPVRAARRADHVLALFLTHGAVFLALKTDGDHPRAGLPGRYPHRRGRSSRSRWCSCSGRRSAYTDQTWTWVPVLLAARVLGRRRRAAPRRSRGLGVHVQRADDRHGRWWPCSACCTRT